MDYQQLQIQYNKIYAFFKTTTEPFDLLMWDGEILEVLYENNIIEKYSFKELREISCL